MKTVDLIILYRIIKILATPWRDQEAYHLGLINANGKLVREPKTPQELNAYNYLHRFIFNIKRLIELVPGGKTKIGTYAAALLLLKEDIDKEEKSEMDKIFEDGMAMSVGGGAPTNHTGAGIATYPQILGPVRRRKKFLEGPSNA